MSHKERAQVCSPAAHGFKAVRVHIVRKTKNARGKLHSTASLDTSTGAQNME